MVQIDNAPPQDAPHSVVRAVPAIAATVRLAMAAILAYFFVVVLMTNAAQSEAAARLKQAKLDYSSSYALLLKADADEEPARIAKRLAARRAFNRAHQAQVRTADDYNDLTSTMVSVRKRLADNKVCDAPSEDLRAGAIGHQIDQLAQCDKSGEPMPVSLREDIRSVVADRAQLVSAAQAWLKAFYDEAYTKQDFEEMQAQSTGLRESVKDIGPAFAPIHVLRDTSMLGRGLLVQFPPSMMQIITAFFSGTFGALLIALVLVVYPSAKLTLTTPGGNYGERVLLGGLIAVCVYIVLGGGSAVLGSANAFSDGSANYQAFSAIGVLAGMFSDRVAQWLSSRADSFYGSDTRNDKKSGNGGTV